MELPAAFGKYHLLERLAVGGMAEVFLAKAFGAAGFERILVIKKILPHMSEDEEFITMFIDEARIASSLSHSNIIQITELGKEGTDYYIAMEYVMGKDLSRIYEKVGNMKQAMPIPLAVLVASRICEGLEYAHRKKDSSGMSLNIIHRDVSPGNVLVSYDGDIKLIDFGIAKAQMRMGHTSAGTLKGKFGYMSPEQVRGKRLDHRSDIFSVGILLYEMLTGEKLFGSQSDFGTLEKVRNARVAPPSTYNSKIPDELERVVMKALAREPEERYEWASDMQEDLVRFLMNEGSLTTSKSLSVFMKDIFSKELMLENRKMAIYRKRGYPWVDAAKGEDPKDALEPLSSDDGYEAVPKTTMDPQEPDESIQRPSTDSVSEEATQIFYSNPSIPLKAEDPWANEPSQEPKKEVTENTDPLSDPRVNQPTIIFDEEELSGESGSLDDFDSYEGEETSEVQDAVEQFFPLEPSTERKGTPLAFEEVSVSVPDDERRRKQQAARRRIRAEVSNSQKETTGTEYMGGRKGRAGPLKNRPESSRPKSNPVVSSRRKQQSTIRLVLLAAFAGLLASGVLGYFLFFRGHSSSQAQASTPPVLIVPEPIKPPESPKTVLDKKDKSDTAAEKSPQAGTLSKNPLADDREQENKNKDELENNSTEKEKTQATSEPKLAKKDESPDKTVDKLQRADLAQKTQQGEQHASITPEKPPIADHKKNEPASLLGVAVINSIPQGAEIFINGKEMGQTPKTIGNLDRSKPLLLSLKKKGYRKYTSKITAGPDGKTSVDAKLDHIVTKHKTKRRKHRKSKPKGSGWLVANTSPWAKVIIDGKDTGLWTPVVGKNKIKLRAGRHRIVFRTKDGRKMKLKIKIQADKTTKVIRKIP